MNISAALNIFTSGTILSANQYTGIRKKENGKRNSCMVERCSIGVLSEDKKVIRAEDNWCFAGY